MYAKENGAKLHGARKFKCKLDANIYVHEEGQDGINSANFQYALYTNTYAGFAQRRGQARAEEVHRYP